MVPYVISVTAATGENSHLLANLLPHNREDGLAPRSDCSVWQIRKKNQQVMQIMIGLGSNNVNR